MLVSPLPGIDPSELLRLLRELKSEVDNLHTVGVGRGLVGSTQRMWEYLEWVDQAVRRLGQTVGAADADRLVRTRGYELLLGNSGVFGGAVGADTPQEQLLNTMVTNELTARSDALTRATVGLEDARRWRSWAWLAVLDTNVYLEHERKLEELDLAELMDAGDQPVHLLVPIAVVDELDRAKRNPKTRYRGAYSLAHIIKTLDEDAGVLREADPGSGPDRPARGRITVEIVSDPPGHRRMPDPDDEIADRALAVQLRAGAPVTLVTYDTGMSWRATEAGLTVVTLDYDAGDEPPPSSRRTSRRARRARSESAT
ncbi:PIN domain-containing protein [Saccharothrix sp. NRRL B-16348]|uniref:PIN domain-containing protein n=1 Tax=Saccharothrix sp. NRRL B-16348 TaxID=1415542 RepID=UPI0006AF2446|nr:PIN domain-containing protein [Saccharothrix sp. NRRL B-16348]